MKTLYPAAAYTSVCKILFLLSLSLPCISQQSMRANLLVPGTATPVLMDGNLTNYADIYSNDVDMDDAWKMPNFGENFGLIRSGHTLVVERREVIRGTDTAFFKMWNLQPRTYLLQFILKDFNQPRLNAILVDKYKNQQISLKISDTTNYEFTVTSEPASYNSGRFYVAYQISNPVMLPVSIFNFKAIRNGAVVKVSWDVINEMNINKYSVEHSLNGLNFTPVKEIVSANSGTAQYEFVHSGAAKQENLYRVRAERSSGQSEYSQITKVSGFNAEMNVYPNPVQNKRIQLIINDSEPGPYTFMLTGTDGKKYFSARINITGNSSKEIVLPAGFKTGIYFLTISSEQKTSEVIRLNIL